MCGVVILVGRSVHTETRHYSCSRFKNTSEKTFWDKTAWCQFSKMSIPQVWCTIPWKNKCFWSISVWLPPSSYSTWPSKLCFFPRNTSNRGLWEFVSMNYETFLSEKHETITTYSPASENCVVITDMCTAFWCISVLHSPLLMAYDTHKSGREAVRVANVSL